MVGAKKIPDTQRILSKYSSLLPRYGILHEYLLRLSIKDYIKQLLSYEEYSFSWDELVNATGKNQTSTKRELSRLVDKKEVINLRKGFYLIIPPRYSTTGKLPLQLYADKLFKYLNRQYYLGFYSAAKIHGASHQQVQRDYIMTQNPPLIDINKILIDIRFITTTNWPEENILIKKSDAGIYKISSPALTAADLIHYQTKLGGLNRMLAVIQEITEEIDEHDLANLRNWYPHKSTLQRLGFVLDKIVDEDYLSDIIFNHLKSNKYYPVLLSPNSKQKPGAVYNKWKVDVNIELESDI